LVKWAREGRLARSATEPSPGPSPSADPSTSRGFLALREDRNPREVPGNLLNRGNRQPQRGVARARRGGAVAAAGGVLLGGDAGDIGGVTALLGEDAAGDVG